MRGRPRKVAPIDKLDMRQIKAVELIVTRDINGMTLEDIAQEVGVDTKTLYRWRTSNEDFIVYMEDRAEIVQRSFISEAYTQLRLIMTKGNNHDKLKALDLFLKNQGKLKQIVEESIEINDKSAEDLDAEYRDLFGDEF